MSPLRPRAVVIQAALLAVAAPPAWAFDGAFVAIPGGSWDLTQGPVEYVLDPAGSDDIEGGAELDALRAAFRAWECVEGVALRFVEGAGPGPAEVNLEDGKNTLFWDETGAYGLGAATLGVTIGDALEGRPRRQADIVFNGAGVTWSTTTTTTTTTTGAGGGATADVMSIALHEIGHFVGLDHPCDKRAGGAETNCNGPERSVMTPAWSGNPEHAPLPDDEEGVRALYPLDPGESASCDGPARRGERCACDGECADGLVCVGLDTAARVCAAPCASDAADCGEGYVCALDAPDGERADGVCLKVVAGGAPAGAVCQRNTQCASGSCALLFEFARSLCEVACETDADCGGGACFEDFCFSRPLHEACPAPPPPPACGCTSTSASAGSRGATVVGAIAAPAPGVGALVLLLLSGVRLASRRRAWAGASRPAPAADVKVLS